MQLHRDRDKFEQAGVRLTLIGQATPRHAAHFRRRTKIDLPVLADEERTSYKAAGAKKATASELIGPKLVAKGIKTALTQGALQTRTIGDNAQLGGSMLVKPDGSVSWTHMSEDAGDNASSEEILEAARQATAG
jgi:prostamide/prostaglandin F2alpha synthase